RPCIRAPKPPCASEVHVSEGGVRREHRQAFRTQCLGYGRDPSPRVAAGRLTARVGAPYSTHLILIIGARQTVKLAGPQRRGVKWRRTANSSSRARSIDRAAGPVTTG